MAKTIIVRPDKALRRRVLLGVATALAVGLLAVYGLNNYAWTLLNSNDPAAYQRLLQLAQWIIFSMPVAVFGLVGWLLWVARRIFETNQYPLPGQKVIRPTPLRTGPAARRMAWSLVVISIVLLVLEMLLTYYALQISWSLETLPEPNHVSDSVR